MEMTVLVVDDSEVNRVVASSKLKEAGFAVQTANDGFEAIELLLPEFGKSLSHPPFAAVLLDIMMPEMDGMEVLRKVREKWSSIQLPIIMATAKGGQEDILSALSAGANDYVTKPLDLPILLARLSTHLQLKESHESLQRAQGLLIGAARVESTGLLAAGLAHEIRNPLGQIQMAIAGLASFAEKLPEEDRDTGEMIMSSIRNAVATADKIIVDLMRASEKQRLSLVATDMNDVVSRVIAGSENRGVSVEFFPGENLPTAKIAEEEFSQALDEVLKNAVQAASAVKEGGKVEVKTESGVFRETGSRAGGRSGNRLRNGEPVISVSVSDNGPGMTSGEIESAFDAFYTTRNTGAGVGLGLTLARQFMESQGGSVRLEKREDREKGVTAVLYLKSSGGLTTNV